jgi:uncharacterized protein (TIRG00374 family)
VGRDGEGLPRPAGRLVSRGVKIGLQIAVSGGILAFLLVQINVRRTFDLVASSHWGYLLIALAIFLATTFVLALRWQLLLRSKGIREPLSWLTRLYFIGYAAGQVLPTSMGGDAVRIVEHARRRPNAKAEVAGAVLLERVIGATATLLLVALGMVAAIGRYNDIELLLWVEVVGLASVAILVFLLFSRRTRRLLERRIFPLGRRIKLERPLERVHAALHGYRDERGVLAVTLGLTVGVQAARLVAIWLCGEAVGVDVSPLVYVIMGPLLFLVLLVPFTINGLGVREAFFVAFLARFGVDKDAAFATGFLFYAVTMATALPGAFFLLAGGMLPSAPADGPRRPIREPGA